MELIETGFLDHSEYRMIFLKEDHLPRIMNLQTIIVNYMEYEDKTRSMFNPSSAEFMRQHIDIKGKMIGIFVRDDLIAYHALYFPEIDEPDYQMGKDIGLPRSEMIGVVNFQDVLVHPSYRGRGLGLKMNRFMLQLANQSECRHIFSTVSPFNISSVKMFFRTGFVIRELKYKYGGKLRYIFYLDSEKRLPKSDPYVSVVHRDIDEQQRLIRQGYSGIGTDMKDKTLHIIYGSLR
jgi:GNAT superfamily N-acetyltransferase